MTEASLTISDRIQNKLDDLTRAERQLALSILENYPASGLGPLSALAKDAKVSVPTVARMVQKLGFVMTNSKEFHYIWCLCSFGTCTFI